jgi:hypothetical protein
LFIDLLICFSLFLGGGGVMDLLGEDLSGFTVSYVPVPLQFHNSVF